MNFNSLHRREFLGIGFKTAATAAVLKLVPAHTIFASGSPVIDSFNGNPDELEDLLKIVTRRGGDYCDVFLEQKASRKFRMEDGRLSNMDNSVTEGMAFRVEHNGKTYFHAAEGFSRKAAVAAAKKVRHSIPSRAKEIRLVPPAPRPAVDSGVFISRLKLEKTTPALIGERLNVLNSRISTISNMIRGVTINYHDEIRRILVLNSDGVYVSDTQPLVDLTIECTAHSGSRQFTAKRRISNRCGFDLLTGAATETALLETAACSVEMLSARPVSKSAMPVILMPEAAAWLAWYLIHGVLDSRNGFMQNLRMSPAVTLLDSGRIVNGRGSAHFDDEGNRSRETTVIHQGRFADRLNRRSGAAGAVKMTGNARRDSYSSPPVISPTNSFLQAMEHFPACNPDSMESGLLVESAVPVGPIDQPGTIQLSIRSGYRIERYQKLHPVRDLILRGRLVNVFDRITASGADVVFIPASYRDTGIPISCGSPSLSVSSLEIQQM